MKLNKAKWSAFMPFIGMIAVFLLFTILTGGSLASASSLKRMLTQAYTVMLIAIGASFIYMHGGIDFSLGSVLALSEMCAALLFEAVGLTWTLLPMCILVAVLCGLVTGLATVKLNVPPFIASLCMQLSGRGILNTVLNSRMVSVNVSVPSWTSRLIVLVIVIVLAVLLSGYTRVGKYNKAIGENKKTAWTSGINVGFYRLMAYLICGVTVGIAAYFDLRRVGVLTGNSGLGMEMDVLIALVMGGLSLSGGYRSSIRCAIIGSLTIVILENGLTILGLSSSYMGIVEGIVFLFVVLFTYKRTKSPLLPR
ncbi:MAG: ABC transporter permease [Clostridiales bacterium]|nr:ABC transporter permease [Clostridiales bacterium]